MEVNENKTIPHKMNAIATKKRLQCADNKDNEDKTGVKKTTNLSRNAGIRGSGARQKGKCCKCTKIISPQKGKMR